jgi:hypothetical protein
LWISGQSAALTRHLQGGIVLELLVQSWFLLTVSLLTVLALVVGVQRSLRLARQLRTSLRGSVTVQVAPPQPQLYAVPQHH